ncbi:uncharacterized protein LOC124286092 [Haliotis rubra]|uniref:uncharacterized protein LOC124286092 n=1 Tax=Haliotis rubra TaxID=36100 RepID=UPI001EE5BA34|nr:uncharacterized protein LOC124286092 [Haliotis rubra]
MKNMGNPRQLDVALIRAIMDHPVFYDKNSWGYNDIEAKEKLWTEIAASLNLEVDACRARWKNLRDTFVKSRRKKPQFRRVGTKFVRQTRVNRWRYTDEMAFLVPYLNLREPEKADSTITDDTEFEITTNDIKEDLDQEGLAQEEEGETTRQSRKRSRASNQTNIRPSCSSQDPDEATEERPTKVYHQPMLAAPQEMDDIESFFYSMGQSVRNLPKHLHSRVKLRVCQVVTEAEVEFHTPTVTVYSGEETLDVKPVIDLYQTS